MPATSRTAPTSHGDPGGYFRNHPPVLWAMFAVAGVIIAVGMAGVYLVDRNSDVRESSGSAPGVNTRGEQTIVANSGPGGSTNTVVQIGESIQPTSLVVPRGGEATMAVAGDGQACNLKNNEDSVAALGGGASYTFKADKPGEFRFSCEGQPQRGQLVLTVP